MIDEPVTTATDFVLAALAAALGGRLLARNGPGHRAAAMWGGALVALAVGAFAGALWHGFSRGLPPGVSSGLWRSTLAAIGVASFLFCAASFRAALPRPQARIATALATILLALYGAVLVHHDAFVWAIAAYAPAMAIALALPGRRGNRWIVAGVAATALGSAVQIGGLSLHRYFDHNDLYHVIQMVAVVLFFRGGEALTDSPREL